MESDDDFMYDEDELSDPEDDQDEDFDIDCDVEAAGCSSTATKRYWKEEDDFKFDCLTPESIVVTMKESIDEVNSVFEIPSATARILLTHFKWDKEKLLERYYSSDQETLFKEAHVISPYRHRQPSISRIKKSSTRLSSKKDCGICLVPVQLDILTGLQCGHIFCQYCWKEYLKTKVLSENTGQNIFCPQTNCDILVDEVFVSKLLHDQPSVLSRYHKLIADGFVQSNRLIKWCPAPDCNNAIKALYVDAKPVTCKCGYIFCFKCAQPSHDPVQCHWLKKWLKKCDDDSETAHWISAILRNVRNVT